MGPTIPSLVFAPSFAMSAIPEASTRTFVLASRTSQLAQVQTNMVRDAIRAAFPSASLDTSFMTTGGDHNQSQALYLLGGKSLWTKELEVALKEGVVDMLVHSYKDVPTVLPEGCEIAGVMEREDPADSLVVRKDLSYKSLEELPNGSVVGTSSVRRVAQLKRVFPQLVFKDVVSTLPNQRYELFDIVCNSGVERQPVRLIPRSRISLTYHAIRRNTRIAKLDAADSPYTALILAKAGLVRLGWGPRITSDITAPSLYHAVSQGALAIEIRSDDAASRALCRAVTHIPTEWTCAAERACLRVLEGGCSVPVGVNSELVNGTLKITGCVTSLDGASHVQHTLEESVPSLQEAEAVGAKLARILMDAGAKAILDEITIDREKRIGEEKTKEEKERTEAAIAA